MREFLRVLFQTLLVDKFDISLVDVAAEALFPLICLYQVVNIETSLDNHVPESKTILSLYVPWLVHLCHAYWLSDTD
jgi:hypothetical protein